MRMLLIFQKMRIKAEKIFKKEVPVTNGLKQDDAKKIVKLIKDSNLKVQAIDNGRYCTGYR